MALHGDILRQLSISFPNHKPPFHNIHTATGIDYCTYCGHPDCKQQVPLEITYGLQDRISQKVFDNNICYDPFNKEDLIYCKEHADQFKELVRIQQEEDKLKIENQVEELFKVTNEELAKFQEFLSETKNKITTLLENKKKFESK